MYCCICDTTALACLRTCHLPGRDGFTRAPHLDATGSAQDIGPSIRALLERWGASPSNLQVIVSSARERSRAHGVASRVMQSPYPEGSFVDMGRGIACVSPELLFVELAHKLPLAQTVLLGYELTGAYSIVPSEMALATEELADLPYAFTSVARAPITSVQRIRAYLERAGAIPGVQAARKALAYVHEGAESPEESKMAIAATLPNRLGGYARGPITMAKTLDGTLGVRRCDAYLHDGDIDLEYQSDRHHAGPDAARLDEARANILRARGITVINVRTEDLRDPERFDIIMRAVAKAQGKRFRIRTHDFEARRAELWRALFPPAKLRDGWTSSSKPVTCRAGKNRS